MRIDRDMFDDRHYIGGRVAEPRVQGARSVNEQAQLFDDTFNRLKALSLHSFGEAV